MAAFLSALGIIGGVMGAAGQIQQGISNSKLLKNNARVEEYNASLARAKAALDEKRFRQTTRLRMGTFRATEGASNLISEGMDAFVNSAVNEELDALLIRYDGELSAWQATTQAEQFRAGAKNERKSSYLRAASQLLGASQFIPSLGSSASPTNPSTGGFSTTGPSRRFARGST